VNLLTNYICLLNPFPCCTPYLTHILKLCGLQQWYLLCAPDFFRNLHCYFSMWSFLIKHCCQCHNRWVIHTSKVATTHYSPFLIFLHLLAQEYPLRLVLTIHFIDHFVHTWPHSYIWLTICVICFCQHSAPCSIFLWVWMEF
jgi:hypothetical protein